MLKVIVSMASTVSTDGNAVNFHAGLEVTTPAALAERIVILGAPMMQVFPLAQLSALAVGTHKALPGEQLVEALLVGTRIDIQSNNVLELRQLIGELLAGFQQVLHYLQAAQAFAGEHTYSFAEDGRHIDVSTHGGASLLIDKPGSGRNG